jgi:hypothetical protein
MEKQTFKVVTSELFSLHIAKKGGLNSQSRSVRLSLLILLLLSSQLSSIVSLCSSLSA